MISESRFSRSDPLCFLSYLTMTLWVVFISLRSHSFCIATQVLPRHCRGDVKHLHLAVGRDPSTQMTVSFASKWSYPDVDAPLGGVHVGRSPDRLDRFVGEQEYPVRYISNFVRKENEPYYSPYQHHITIDGLEPNTTYYYVAVVGAREQGLGSLAATPLRDHPSQHIHENIEAEKRIKSPEQFNEESDENDRYLVRHRRLAPPPYDPSDKPCIEGHKVRSFNTAPIVKSASNSMEGGNKMAMPPVTFAIIGDLGQFEHSKETLEHMSNHREKISAVMLVGDIAYTEYDHRRWDTFFDFLDDYSIFDEVPLQVATGNHDIDKQENGTEIFQAYETRFRMPQVHPAALGVYDGPKGLLNMDVPPYPLPYEWGNAYYTFDYGPAKHIVVSAYSSMEPGSTQYMWLQDVLRAVDRRYTPWVLVTIHVPLYSTFALHLHDLQIVAARKHLEPLFVKHHINVVFTGHIHAYQRTSNVANDTLVETGPIHITVGAGGRQCDAPFKSEEPEPWVVTRDSSFYGYGKFSIMNQTHAEWRWIPLSPSDKHDYNEVKGEDVHLPQLHHDALVIENQFFLKQD